MLEKLKSNKTFIYTLVPFLIIIFIITNKIIIGKELIIDHIAYNVIVGQLRNPTMTIIMKNITKLSNTSYILLITIIITLLFIYKWKKKKIAVIIPSNLLFITILNQLFKAIFQRERPSGYRLIEASGYSFPSGHAMVSLAFYGLIIYVIYCLVKNKHLRNFLITINIILIILIGISRVYLGVHYISDIIVGYSISIIYLVFFIKIIKKLMPSHNIQ